MSDPVKRKPGRPRAFDRSHALDTAMHLFWRHGYEGTSTAALASSMGLAAPSLYAAFGSKQALYQEALAHYQLVHGDFLPRALEQGGTPRAVLLRVLQGAAALYTKPDHPPGCMVATAAIQCAPEQAAIADQTRQARQDARNLIEQYLRQARAQGQLPADADPASLATWFALVIQGMAVQAHDGASRATLLRCAEAAVGVLPAA